MRRGDHVADNEFEIPVVVTTKGAPDGTVSGIGRFSSAFGRAFGAIQRHPIVIAAVILYKGITASLAAWREQESSVSALNQALINQGMYTRELSQQYQDMALAFQKETIYGDEEVLAAQASLQPFLHGKRISQELMQAVVDFASGNQVSLSSAASAIGKTIGTSTNALMRYGIAIDATMSSQEKLDLVIKGVSARWGGQAEASTQGLGSIIQARHALQGLLETAGRAMEPLLVLVVKAITEFAQALSASTAVTEGIGRALDGIDIGVRLLASVISSAMKAVPIIVRGQLGSAIENMKGNFETAHQMQSEGATELEALAAHAYADVERVWKAKTTSTLYQQTKEKIISDSVAAQREARERTHRDIDAIFQARTEKDILELRARQILRSDHSYAMLVRQAAHEKDLTRLHELELEKKAKREEALRKVTLDFHQRNNILGAISDKESLKVHQPVLAQLAEVRNSKFGPQILIGKAAAIGQIGINTTLAIANATAALDTIPPPVGEALAVAFSEFLLLYGAEQIKNIAGITIDTPGRIGQLQLNLPSILESLWGYMGSQYEALGRSIGLILGFTGSLVSDIGDEIQKGLASLGPIGDVLGMGVKGIAEGIEAYLDTIGWIYETAYVLIGQTIQRVVSVIANAVNDVVVAIGETIGSALDSLFGWLFAEGGVVSHSERGASVTPLRQSGLQLHRYVNVTIIGGLVPSAAEAQRIAVLISDEMR